MEENRPCKHFFPRFSFKVNRRVIKHLTKSDAKTFGLKCFVQRVELIFFEVVSPLGAPNLKIKGERLLTLNDGSFLTIKILIIRDIWLVVELAF